MAKKFLASVAEVQLFVKEDSKMNLFATANTLTDTALSFTNTMEEVRGGQGGKLYGRFGHTTGITLQMTDIMMDLNYFKALIGAEIEENSGSVNDMHMLSNIAFVGGKANLPTGEPAPVAVSALCGADKIVAWANKAGCGKDNSKYYALEYENGEFDGGVDMEDGAYCVKYFAVVNEGTYAKINAKFQPMELFARLSIPEFAADAGAATSEGIVGHLIFNFPRYQFDGNFDLSLAMTSNATISLNGTVLATPAGDCEGNDYYGEIMEIPTSASADLSKIKDIIVDTDHTHPGEVPQVWGVYTTSAKLLPMTMLTFTAATEGDPNPIANGKWRALRSGEDSYDVKVTLTDTELYDIVTIHA